MKRRREQRKQEAKERQEARERRSDAQQIKVLERRGHGHCKEAKRLRDCRSDGTDKGVAEQGL